MKYLKDIYDRIVNHWPTSVAGVLLFIGFYWIEEGKININDLQTYVALIGTIILLLMKSFNGKIKDS